MKKTRVSSYIKIENFRNLEEFCAIKKLSQSQAIDSILSAYFMSQNNEKIADKITILRNDLEIFTKKIDAKLSKIFRTNSENLQLCKYLFQLEADENTAKEAIHAAEKTAISKLEKF